MTHNWVICSVFVSQLVDSEFSDFPGNLYRLTKILSGRCTCLRPLKHVIQQVCSDYNIINCDEIIFRANLLHDAFQQSQAVTKYKQDFRRLTIFTLTTLFKWTLQNKKLLVHLKNKNNAINKNKTINLTMKTVVKNSFDCKSIFSYTLLK